MNCCVQLTDLKPGNMVVIAVDENTRKAGSYYPDGMHCEVIDATDGGAFNHHKCVNVHYDMPVLRGDKEVDEEWVPCWCLVREIPTKAELKELRESYPQRYKLEEILVRRYGDSLAKTFLQQLGFAD